MTIPEGSGTILGSTLIIEGTPMLLWFGIAPWLFCLELTLCLGIVILVELELYGWSTTLLVVGLVASHYYHVFSIADVFRHHSVALLTCTLCYFPAGSIWMILKWFLFLHKFKDARKDALEEFHRIQQEARDRTVSETPYNGDPSLLEKTDREYLASEYYKNTPLYRAPRVRDYKARTIGWVCFWVFSVVGTLFHDIVRRIGSWIYNRLSGLLQWMSDKVVGEIPEPTKVESKS